MRNTITIVRENDLEFSINFYQNGNIIDIEEVSEPSLNLLMEKFELYVSTFRPTKGNQEQSKTKLTRNYITAHIKTVKNLLRRNRLNVKIIQLYLASSVNVDTVNGFNGTSISRTIIKSFNRINILPSRIPHDRDSTNLLKLHNLNIKLFDYVIQNKLSIFFYSLIVVIALIRIIITMFWIVADITIFSFGTANSLYFIILNIVLPLVWVFTPSLLSMITKLIIKFSIRNAS